MKYVQWIDPSPSGDPELHKLTTVEATQIAIAVAATKGKSYKSKLEALEDFIVIHHAEIVDIDE